MTDWNVLKIAELKEECKKRDIPLTGLKLKQQYIDKIIEFEAEQGNGPTKEEATEALLKPLNSVAEEQANVSHKDESRTDAAAGTVESTGTYNSEYKPRVDGRDTDRPKEDVTLEAKPWQADDGGRPADQKEEKENGEEVLKAPVTKREVNGATMTPDTRPTMLKAEPSEDKMVEDTDGVAREDAKDDILLPDEIQIKPDEIKQKAEEIHPQPDDEIPETNVQELKQQMEQAQDVPTKIVRDDEMADAREESREGTPAEELRKRKRRSTTPTPNSAEVAKKRKSMNGGAVAVSRSPSPVHKQGDQDKITGETSFHRLDPEHEANGHVEESMVDEADAADGDVQVSPALHAPTCSLYIRNFKRPLSTPSLRAHLVALARSESDDPVKLFYVDNIRSHAFVRFSSVAEAQRVRNRMHENRFPDEPMREPLWCDFVPDDQIQGWVDQETDDKNGSSGMGRNSMKGRFEVSYNRLDDGYQAELREVSAFTNQNQNSRGGISNGYGGRQASLSHRQSSHSATTGLHQDRLTQAAPPRSPEQRRRTSPKAAYTSREGKEYDRACTRHFQPDDGLLYTKAKPALSFKEVPRDLVDSRLDLIRDLTDERGMSGDAGMKRYTFESERAKEYWVDNGPEFGHGKRGQDALEGRSRPPRGGTYRGRGGRPLVDSYRGSSRRY